MSNENIINLSVYTKKELYKIKNFWNHIHFHPTDAIEDEWGQRILNQVAEDKVAKTIRMYAMFEDIVTMDQEGRLQYNFELNDERMDYLLSKGFNLLIIYAYVPPCVALNNKEISTVCKNSTRYKGKYILTSPPTSYKIWEEICATYTKHIVERYGEEVVSKWYLECHNEPDLNLFWMQNENDMKVRCQEYCKLYDAFESGILRVSKKLRIGGPSLAKNYEFLKMYLQYVKGENHRLDFITIHTYGTTVAELNAGTKPFAADNSVKDILEVKRIMDDSGFGDVPLVIDEWGASNCGFYNMEECPLLIFREKASFAAYFAKMITHYVELRLPIEMLMICLSGQHEMVTDFSGFRNFFTLNFFQKPIYNAYCLTSKLGNSYVESRGNNNDNLSVLPTVDKDGRVAILFGYASKNFDQELPPLTIDISIPDFKGIHTGNLYRIDETHANAMYVYEQLESPKQLTEEQIREIRSKAKLAPEQVIYSEMEPISITLTNNSTVLLLLE